jgi:hypothetical protein
MEAGTGNRSGEKVEARGKNRKCSGGKGGSERRK